MQLMGPDIYLISTWARSLFCHHNPGTIMIAERTARKAGTRNASIAKSVISMISGAPERAAVSHIVEVSHRLALAYLIRKVNYGNLRAQLFGLDLDDLALDCIADLFQRSKNGRFDVFEQYFGSAKRVRSIDAQVALRRLVFSKVNENLFRRYHEIDANLSRVIRNVKDSVKVDDRLRIVRCRGQQWVVVADASPSTNGEGTSSFHLDRPIAPPEILQTWFMAHLCDGTRVRELLGQFSAFVDRHPHYAPGYRLIALAQVVRAAYMHDESDGSGPDETGDYLLPYEVEDAIEAVTERLMIEKRSGYVGGGKVDEDTYNAYFDTIRTILSRQYLYDDQPESYYAALCEVMPGLTDETYMQQHRNILEYLAKLSRTRLLRYLGENIS